MWDTLAKLSTALILSCAQETCNKQGRRAAIPASDLDPRLSAGKAGEFLSLIILEVTRTLEECHKVWEYHLILELTMSSPSKNPRLPRNRLLQVHQHRQKQVDNRLDLTQKNNIAMKLIRELGAAWRRIVCCIYIGLRMSCGREGRTIAWGTDTFTQVFTEPRGGVEIWKSGDMTIEWKTCDSQANGETESESELDVFIEGIGGSYKGRALTVEWDMRTPRQKYRHIRGTAVLWKSGMEPDVMSLDFLDKLKKSEQLD
ncbi:hypothetical protein ARMGADRAFT_1096209 [Armillaria gallica]|uniref:Fungal-type protein kinase domain-containing protein n=1 Tax=Armillaria gallica TaxID=47427 RepID=A0A2H3E9F2_ARMGA|nr:hypothetical protein ARMGADRAFT_1096209 [Armillaria gallica]